MFYWQFLETQFLQYFSFSFKCMASNSLIFRPVSSLGLSLAPPGPKDLAKLSVQILPGSTGGPRPQTLAGHRPSSSTSLFHCPHDCFPEEGDILHREEGDHLQHLAREVQQAFTGGDIWWQPDWQLWTICAVHQARVGWMFILAGTPLQHIATCAGLVAVRHFFVRIKLSPLSLRVLWPEARMAGRRQFLPPGASGQLTLGLADHRALHHLIWDKCVPPCGPPGAKIAVVAPLQPHFLVLTGWHSLVLHGKETDRTRQNQTEPESTRKYQKVPGSAKKCQKKI